MSPSGDGRGARVAGCRRSSRRPRCRTRHRPSPSSRAGRRRAAAGRTPSSCIGCRDRNATIVPSGVGAARSPSVARRRRARSEDDRRSTSRSRGATTRRARPPDTTLPSSVGCSVMSLTQSRSGPSTVKRRLTRSSLGTAFGSRRVQPCAATPVDAFDPGLAHQPPDPFAADAHARPRGAARRAHAVNRRCRGTGGGSRRSCLGQLRDLPHPRRRIGLTVPPLVEPGGRHPHRTAARPRPAGPSSDSAMKANIILGARSPGRSTPRRV